MNRNTQKHSYSAAIMPARLVVALLAGAALGLLAQAPGVKIMRDRGEEFEALVQKADEYRAAGKLLSAAQVREQLARTSCVVNLPKPATKALSDRQIWQRSRESHARLGWHYLCGKCDKWHLGLSGGCFITPDGVIATCYHVIKPNPEHRQASLVAADEEGRLFPVAEVLAANEFTDTALVRAQVDAPVKCLALNTNVYPGDGAWCYSDPLGRAGYFSKGMVNRFYYQKSKDREGIRLEVSTDWAPGSSGSAVVDEAANVIGLVSTIQPASSTRARGTNQPPAAASTMITFHSAARAADIIALVKPPARR